MSADRRFERALPDILADLGAGPTDDYSQLLARTARTRQRPAWSFLERWLPMDLAMRPASAVITPRRLSALVALLILASLIGVALLAGSRPSVPPPFGVARNGSIAFADAQGRIWSGDPSTLESTLIVASPDNSRPVFSPDGRRLVYVHDAGVGHDVLVVSRPDGTAPRTIEPDPSGRIGLLQWSPDSRSVVFSRLQSSRLYQYDAETASPGPVLSDDADQDLRDDGRFVAQVQYLFRPPAGDQLLTISRNGTHDTLIVSSLDGRQRTVILDDPSFEDIVNATWSTDGQRIAFNSSQPGEAFPYHTWIMNADGTGIRRVFKDPLDRTDQNPIWSPDGRWIAVQRWYNPPEGVDVRPITIVDPDSGAFHEVGEVHMNGYDGWGWSPDGRSIIEVPGNLPGETQLANPVIIVDATTGKEIDSGWEARSNLAWQRQAP